MQLSILHYQGKCTIDFHNCLVCFLSTRTYFFTNILAVQGILSVDKTVYIYKVSYKRLIKKPLSTALVLARFQQAKEPTSVLKQPCGNVIERGPLSDSNSNNKYVFIAARRGYRSRLGPKDLNLFTGRVGKVSRSQRSEKAN